MRTHLHPWGFVAAKERWKMTVTGSIHDMMAQLRQNGAGGRQLIGRNNPQSHIYELSHEKTIEFKFEILYKHSRRHTSMLYYPTRKPPWI